MKTDVIFGEKIKDEDYDVREGSYGLVINAEKVAIIKTSTGYFLPGGGIEDGESHFECLKREFLEETGYDIQIKDYIGKAAKYHFSKVYYRYRYLVGNFYFVDLKTKIAEKIEEDHELIWIHYKEAISKLFLENQKWAVEKAFMGQVSNK